MGAGCSAKRKPSKKSITSADCSGKRLSVKFGPQLRKFEKNPLERPSCEYSDAQFARVDEKSKSRQDIEFIKIALSKHIVFTNLTEDQLNSVIVHMKYYRLEANEVVFQQGSMGSIFFVVAHGKLEVLIDGNKVNALKPQDTFGDYALMHDTPRTATVRTTESTSLWGLDRKTFRTTLDQLNAQEYAENRKLLKTIPVFKILSNTQMESLINTVKVSMYACSQVVVNEGEFGDLLFIIKQGTVVCSISGENLRTLEKGEYFGEKALLENNNRRTATITAAENVKCLTIGRDDLTHLLGTSLQLIVHKNSQRIALDKNELLKVFTKTQYERLINRTEVKEIPQSVRVIEASTKKSEALVMILKGSLQSSDGSSHFQTYDIIGAEEMINDSSDVFEHDLFAVGEVNIGYISRQSFFEAIGGNYFEVTVNNESIKLLKKVELFKNLTEDQYEDLIKVLKLEEFQSNCIIFNEAHPGDSLYLIKEGIVEIHKNNQVVRTITKNDYFGERSLLLEEIRSATVKAKTDTKCLVLHKSDFFKLMDEKLRSILFKRIQLQDDSIQLSDLKIVKSIGKGTFGHVFLVVHKTKRTLFALKTVNKKKIQAFEIEANLMMERKILLQIDHILIVKLVKTFRDKERLYFLCEYINGVNLCDILNKLNVVAVSDAKFYMACIFSMLEHLHERNIIYRDLCPSNLMIDEEGYPKLIDFGSAKIIRGRTYTIATTPAHYMAPEIISGHGYSLSADYWSAGVILFELLFEYLPFASDEKDPYMIYESVLQANLVFPEASDNKDKIKDLICQFLNKNPGSRLPGAFEALKAHPWFISINWDKVVRRALPTPYKPMLASLAREIEAASKQKTSKANIIQEVEKNDIIPKIRITGERVSSNWDDEFDT